MKVDRFYFMYKRSDLFSRKRRFTMQRYFIQPEQFTDETATIAGDDAHHLTRVMRAKPGDTCIVSDGISREALVRLQTVDPRQVVADVIEWLPMDNEPAVDVWVAQSLPKGDKMELVIQKGTEIGASRFIPFVSERTVVQLDGKKKKESGWSGGRRSPKKRRSRLIAIACRKWTRLYPGRNCCVWLKKPMRLGFAMRSRAFRSFGDRSARRSCLARMKAADKGCCS